MRALCLIALVALAACGAPVRRFTPMDNRGITDVLAHQADAWNRGDLAAYMDGYARIDTLVFTSGGHVRRGWQDAFDHYKAKYATRPDAMGHLVFGITQIDAIGGDGAVVLGTWKLTGGEHPADGVFSLVFARRPEGWRIIHDHTSLSTP